MTRVAFGSIATLLLLITVFLFPPLSTGGDLGLCLPSPNQWQLPRWLGWLINTLIIFLSAAIIHTANKKFNFISDAEPVVALALMLLLACNCITTSSLNTSTLLLLCNVLCLFILFTTYEARNATREFFVIGTLPAIGAMTQYAFLVMIPVYIGGGLLMKSFRVRELIAFVFGLLAPYWIALGLGMVSPFEFRLPDHLTIFNRAEVESDIFYTLLAAGIMAFMGVILALYNGVRLFSRNSRLRCMHMTINLMGCVALLAVIFDFNNFVAYFATIALWLAVEFASMLNLYNIRHVGISLMILLLIFLPLYILAI